MLIPENFITHACQHYVLQVFGQGFLRESIWEGDLIVVAAQGAASSGDLILGTVNGQESVIKRYHPEGHYVTLGESGDGHSFTVRQDDLTVFGPITGLLRAF